MDSPESNKIVTSTSASPAVQDSPFFNYLSNLSPIKPVKVAHVARAFSELNFPPPPPVFTSPHINPQPETSFLKRSQYPLSSSGKLSLEHDDEGKIFTECSNVSGRPVTQSMIGLVPCTQKEFDSKRTVQVQSCSPSWLVDEYLVDPIDVESANSPGSGTNDVPQELQSDCTREKEPILKLDDCGDDERTKDDCGDDERTKHMETEMAAPLTTLEQSEDDLLGKSHVCPEGMSGKVNDLVFYNLSPESASGAQDCQHLAVQDVKLQHADGGQLVEYDCNLQLLPESLQIVPAYVDPDKNSGAISNEPVEKMSFDLVEASQHHRGTRRRCLQFEAAEAHRNTIGNSSSVRNPKNIFPNSKLPANPTDLDSLDSSHLESSATYRSNEPVNISHNRISRLTLGPIETPKVCFDKAERSVRNIGNSLIAAPMPSGIGLHLNSIVNATAMGCIEAPSMESTEKDNSNLQREKSPSVTKHRFPEESKSNSSLARNISANHNDDQQESLAIVPESSATSHSPYENVDTFEEFNQLSPKKKRKRTSYTMENEGCKRCNCKRSKCLKLYCECFAAGMYCAEPCACQDCFNKPEYEDTVLGTRQQIESRNPLAFAPKIVSRVTESPANSGEDGGRMTPSSARHKRGCNCKKSMCLKKYCECYQSGVGCSDGCRCEGCKNIFGIKEEHYGTTEMVHRRDDEESWENQSDGNLDMVDTRSNFSHPEQCHARNLSPPIPVVQCSRVEVLKSQLPASRYLPSLESNTNILSSYGKCPISLRNSDSHDRETKMGEGNKEIVSYDLDLECSVAQTGDQFLPGRDGLADICDLTPLPCPPSRVTPSSSSSNTKDSTKVSQVQLHRGTEQFSLVESLRWRSSPITPLPRLGGNKLPQDPSSNAGYEILEDDTPEILKDTCTPIKVVKASSPNQKRVSPPHSYLHELRSNSSPGLRSGRKFVLKSISSFPPLTPHSDPKGSSSGDK